MLLQDNEAGKLAITPLKHGDGSLRSRQDVKDRYQYQAISRPYMTERTLTGTCIGHVEAISRRGN
jgi:hypothetical protein|tara:strand:- start:10331 stop:10525 length:195 start_codon:yes stop_codon:yes gene_type:complete